MRIHEKISTLIPMLALVAACGTTKADKKKEVQRVEVQIGLRRLAESFNNAVQNSAAKIASATDDPEIRYTTIIWQMRVLSGTRLALMQPDPRWAFLDLWSFALQMLHYFEGVGSDIFGDQQQEAVLTARSILENLEVRAQMALGDGFEAARKSVTDFAKEFPVSGRGMRQANTPSTYLARGTSGAFESILNLPAKVFSFGGGVKDTAQSISEVAQAANQISDIVEDLPLSARWNMEILLFNLERTESISRALKDWNRVSSSFEDITKTARELPANVEKTLERIQEQNEDLQKTLDKATGMAQEAKGTIAELDATLKQADETVKLVTEASTSLTRTGEAWLPTIEAADRLLNPPPDPDAEPGPPLDMKDLVKFAENLTNAAVEIQKLVADLNGLIGSPDIGKRLDDVDLAARKAVGYGGDLLNGILWRAAALIAFFFAVLLGYRRLSR